MKLSERLEALLARLDETTDGEYLERLTNGHAIALQCMEFVRDHGPALAELARRVEGAPCVAVIDGGMMIKPFRQYGRFDIPDDDENPATKEARLLGQFVGQRVRIVLDTPTPPAPGHEREGRDA